MDHDTNTCTLLKWPASARGVIQVRPGTISGEGRGGGGGGGGGGGSGLLYASDPIRKVGAL